VQVHQGEIGFEEGDACERQTYWRSIPFELAQDLFAGPDDFVLAPMGDSRLLVGR
jgi:hypothetical protein